MAAQKHEAAAVLWAACAAFEQGEGTRAGLSVDTHPREGQKGDLTVVLAVVDRQQPRIVDMPKASVVLLALSAGSATAEQLARVAVAVDDADGRIAGIVVTDPDTLDRTTGRFLQLRPRPAGTAADTAYRHHTFPSTSQGCLSCHPEAGMSNSSWRLGDVDDEKVAGVSSRLSAGDRPLPSPLAQKPVAILGQHGRHRHADRCCMDVEASRPKSVGTVTLMLAHDPGTDPRQALATDESLLRTRTLGAIVVKRLGLDMSPEGFQQAVVSRAASSDVLILEVSAPDDAAAVARARALAVAYLQFRDSQIRSQLETLRVAIANAPHPCSNSWRTSANSMTRSSGCSSGDSQTAAALLNKQAQVSAQIESTQQSIRDASLKSNSIIDASRVLDQASLEPGPSSARVLLLAMVSGLIGGTAVGAGIVLVRALTSDRLRLREDIALSLEAPVRVSVGSLRRRAQWWALPQA